MRGFDEAEAVNGRQALEMLTAELRPIGTFAGPMPGRSCHSWQATWNSQMPHQWMLLAVPTCFMFTADTMT